MPEAITQVSMNRFAVVSLALYGQQEVVENLYREVAKAVKRLGLKSGPAFSSPPRGQGSLPNMRDVILWIEAVDDTDKYGGDRKLLRRLHATTRVRCRPEVIKAVEEELSK